MSEITTLFDLDENYQEVPSVGKSGTINHVLGSAILITQNMALPDNNAPVMKVVPQADNHLVSGLSDTLKFYARAKSGAAQMTYSSVAAG